MDILKYKSYEGTAELDMERQVCRGKVLFIGDLVTYQAKSPQDLQAEFEAAVDDYLETCRELGRAPQEPLSGTFNVRVGAHLHREMKLRAVRDGVSLNEVVSRAFDCYVNGRSEVTNNNTYLSISSGVETVRMPLGFDGRQGVRSVIN